MCSKKVTFYDVILQQYHNSPIGGHAGDVKSYLRIAADWFWGGMRKDVMNYVRKCAVCQQQ